MSDFSDVGQFHEKFGLPFVGVKGETVPRVTDDSTALFRLQFLLEELTEIAEGYGCVLLPNDDGKGYAFYQYSGATQDLPKIADGLVDLVYVALGTAHLHGLNWDDLFAEVQRANLSKERATSATDGRSTRGHSLDVVKPKGFVPPRIIETLMDAGWKGPMLPLDGDNER
jgi:predicted HAD superfamily Cof-like phosphohydrolase